MFLQSRHLEQMSRVISSMQPLHLFVVISSTGCRSGPGRGKTAASPNGLQQVRWIRPGYKRRKCFASRCMLSLSLIFVTRQSAPAQQQRMWTTGSDIKQAATCAAFCERASRHTGVCLASSSFVFRGAELQRRGWRKTEVCQKQATPLNEWRLGVFKNNSGVSKWNSKPMTKTHTRTELE